MYSLYESNRADTWRYVLGSSGERPLLVIGINPHAATQIEGDRTVRLVEEVARRAHFDCFVMLNVYPVRSKAVRDLSPTAEPLALSENLRFIKEAVSRCQSPSIWAAWGNDIGCRPYLRQAVRAIVSGLVPYQPRWLHYGELTRLGHPRHPSRLSYSWKFNEFNPASIYGQPDA